MVIKNVDERYRKWGLYWDHQEFGGRYFRPMSSWLIINALLGLAVKNKHYRFAPKPKGENVKLFFTFDNGYGHFIIKTDANATRYGIAILSGKFTIKSCTLSGFTKVPESIKIYAGGKELAAKYYAWEKEKRGIKITFNHERSIKENDNLQIRTYV